MQSVSRRISEADSNQQKLRTNELGIDLCRYRTDERIFIRQQKELAKYFMNAKKPVVDLGCGRGTMLELLKSSGVSSYGVDTFSPALEVCRRKGLQVAECDIFSHLEGLPECSVGGIFCSHVIEHLHPPEALRLLRESYRVLSPGGALVLVTPNPKNLLVLTEGFWLDLTHVRFYPARLLKLLLEEVGFNFAQSFEDKYTAYSTVLHRRLGGFLRHLWLWGFTNRGDVVAVGRK
jgi:SAM-dependent methyltransferase